MKQGRTLPELLTELVRQQEVKKDYLVPTQIAEMLPDATFGFGKNGDEVIVRPNDLMHDQIGGHTKIPAQYYDRMLREDKALLANNVNTWFRKYPATRMVRTLDGRGRAFLSDRFRALDNYDLAEAAVPPLMDMGVEVLSCEVTETKMYIKVVDQRIRRDLPVGWSNTNRGHQHFDTLSPALTLSNSEVGAGALSCGTSVYFGGCSNLTAIKEGSVRKYHIGGRHDIGEQVYAMLSDQTKKLTDAALWGTIRDVVKGAFDQAQFDAVVARLKDATEEKIEADPVKVVEITAKRFGFNDTERGAVLRHLIEGGDLTKYGLHNAITRTGQDVESYDRASQLEQVGGLVVELPRNDWTSIMKEAA